MSISQIIQSEALGFIKSHHPFDYLDEDELKAIEQTLEMAQFSAGEHILVQDGSPSQYLYVIYDGAVRLEHDGQVTQVLEDGDLFGYPSLLNQTPPSFEVVAEEDTVAYLIPEAIFRGLVENRGFAEFFMKRLSQRLRLATGVEPPLLEGNLTPPIETLIVRPPVSIGPEATVAEAAQMMRRAWVSSILVTGEPPGIITDRDLRNRILAEGLRPETPARQAMSQPLKTLPAEAPIYGALLLMIQENIHHLPLTRQGQIVGVVTDTDLLRHQAKSPIYLLKQLEKLESPHNLARYALDIAGTVKSLCRGGLDIAQIGRVVASLNDALTRRLLYLAEEDLGPPPTPYAWIVFGSEGRMEQALLTDQDNALIYLGDTVEARDYFRTLADRVMNDLLRAGFPPCPGGYMAANWHRPLDEWIQLFQGWVETPDPQALLETAIFFDFRPVHGTLSLEPLEQIIQEASKRHIFLGQLARSALEFRPPLGFFRRIIRDEDGKVDLKAGGVAPIVSLARVYALEAGARTRSTFTRLEAAAEANTLSQDGAETLAETYRFLLQLRLREQLATIQDGGIPDNKIRLQALSPRENRHLKDAFLAIREMQDATSHRFRTDHLG